MIPKIDEVIITKDKGDIISFYDINTGYTANWSHTWKNKHFVQKGKTAYVLSMEACNENLLETIGQTVQLINIYPN